MKVLITGAAGQVGSALLRHAPQGSNIRAFTRSELDISDADLVERTVARVRPDLIINAAAFTAVDRAEDEPRAAACVNAAGPGHLARAAAELDGCRLLHLSTDYVFDGSSERPYRPDDVPNPLSIYGQTKLAGENSVIDTLGARAVVLRTAWVYAPAGRNFLLTMLRLMRERGAVRVVDDQRGTPTCADSIATTLWTLARRPDVAGIWHWTDGGMDSWCGFARAIAEEAFEMGLLPAPPAVTPISTMEYPTRALRPANSALDSTATAVTLGLTAMPWRENLRGTLKTIATGETAA